MVRYPDSFTAAKTGNYSKLADLNNEIEAQVNSQINQAYKDVLRSDVKISLYLQSGDQYGIVNEGSGHYSGLTVLIKGTDPLDMTVLVRNVEKKAGKKTVEENEAE